MRILYARIRLFRAGECFTKYKRQTRNLPYALHMMNLWPNLTDMVYEKCTAYPRAGSCQKGVD